MESGYGRMIYYFNFCDLSASPVECAQISIDLFRFNTGEIAVTPLDKEVSIPPNDNAVHLDGRRLGLVPVSYPEMVVGAVSNGVEDDCDPLWGDVDESFLTFKLPIFELANYVYALQGMTDTSGSLLFPSITGIPDPALSTYVGGIVGGVETWGKSRTVGEVRGHTMYVEID